MTDAYPMTRIAPTIAAALGLRSPAQAIEEPIAQIVADLAPASRLALLAPDALGEFAWRLWREEMPYLRSLEERTSLTLRSVMPSITPVNFTTMITGAEREVHGIGWLRDDCACETLFDVIRQAGGSSAGCGQPGYTGAELLGRLADICCRAPENDDGALEVVTLNAARERAPTFIIAQLGSTDDIFHTYGPSSPQVVPKLRETDERLRRMTAKLTRLGYEVIITADHGQHDSEGALQGSHGQDRDEDRLVPCFWVPAAPL